MHSNDLEACGKKCCYFWFHSEVKFLTRFCEKRGVGALMHVYVWEHLVSLDYRTTEWMFTKLGRDEVPMPGTCIKMFWPYLPRGRSRARQNRSWGGEGSPSSINFFFRLEGYSNKPNSYLEACVMKCCCFWFHSVVKFLTLESCL